MWRYSFFNSLSLLHRSPWKRQSIKHSTASKKPLRADMGKYNKTLRYNNYHSCIGWEHPTTTSSVGCCGLHYIQLSKMLLLGWCWLVQKFTVLLNKMLYENVGVQQTWTIPLFYPNTNTQYFQRGLKNTQNQYQYQFFEEALTKPNTNTNIHEGS